jgi:hypothetical protein
VCDVRAVRALVAVIAVLGSAGGSLAATDRSTEGQESIEEARDAVLDADYQPQMPDDAFDHVTIRQRDEPGEHPAREEDDTRLRLSIHERSSVARLVVWGLVIVAGGLGIAWLASALRRGRDHSIATPVARAKPTPAILERPLDDADELARDGAYADAIHTLLLRTLHELARSADVRVAPAMTSREILGCVGLARDARDALASLIGAVEVTYFRGDAATPADYDRCRDQFHQFARAFRGAPA